MNLSRTEQYIVDVIRDAVKPLTADEIDLEVREAHPEVSFSATTITSALSLMGRWHDGIRLERRITGRYASYEYILRPIGEERHLESLGLRRLGSSAIKGRVERDCKADNRKQNERGSLEA